MVQKSAIVIVFSTGFPKRGKCYLMLISTDFAIKEGTGEQWGVIAVRPDSYAVGPD